MTKKLIILAIALEILIVISIVFTNLNFYSAINNNSTAEIDDLENTSSTNSEIIVDTTTKLTNSLESSEFIDCHHTFWNGEEYYYRRWNLDLLVERRTNPAVFYKPDDTCKYAGPLRPENVLSYFREQTIMDSVSEESLNFPSILISANDTQTSYVENFEFFISNSERKIGITNYDKKSGILDFVMLNLKDGDYVTVTGGTSAEYNQKIPKMISSSLLIRNASGTDQTIELVINDKNDNEVLKLTVICPHFDWDTIYDGKLKSDFKFKQIEVIG